MAHRPLPVSRAELARLAGVTRGAITRAAKRGGPLHAACIPGGRMDRAHPAARKYIAAAARGRTSAPEIVMSDSTLVTPQELAEMSGRPLAEVLQAMEPGGPLAPGVVPGTHIAAGTLASVLSVPVETVLELAEDELAPALTPQGRFDSQHPAVRRLLAAPPEQRP